MRRRKLAILPDNDRVLRGMLLRLRQELPRILGGRVLAAMVIGSVAEGTAGDASDLDLLLFLAKDLPTREHYRYWDRSVARRLAKCPFPLQPIFVSKDAVQTEEPNLAAAIRKGILLWDRGGLFRRRKPWATRS